MNITNFSIYANLHRNMKRHLVDKLFKAKYFQKSKEEKERLDKEARLLWNKIITEAENLPRTPTSPIKNN